MNGKLYHRLHLLLLLTLLPMAPSWATDKCGAVCDETWDLSGTPYIVTCDVTVASGCSLDIAAGVRVRFQAGTGLIVDGDLSTAGMAGSPVTLEPDAFPAARGDWTGVDYRPGSTGSVTSTEIFYATRAVKTASAAVTIADLLAADCSWAGVEASGGTLDLLDSDFSRITYAGIILTDGVDYTLDNAWSHDNDFIGILITGAASGTIANSATFLNDFGLYVTGSPNGPTTVGVTGTIIQTNTVGFIVSGDLELGSVDPVVSITGSTLFDNSELNFSVLDYDVPSQSVVQAGGNYWGTTDPFAIAATIGDYSDLPSRSPKVDWCSYLDGSPPTGVLAHDAYCPALNVCDETVAWNATDQPYLLTSAVTVCPTGTLDIGPGVTVHAVASTFIEVEGGLDVNGTELAPTTLTSDSATPATHDWSGVRLLAGSTGSIDWAEVAYATVGIEGTSADVSIANATIRDCGFGVEADGGTLNATHSLFSNNRVRGLYLHESAGFAVDNTEVSGSSIGLWIDEGAAGTLTDVNVHDNQSGLLVGASTTTTDPTVVDITGSGVTGNQGGIFVRGSDVNPASINPAVTVSGSSIFDNIDYNYYSAGFLNPETAVLSASLNWWGTKDATAIGATIVDYFSSSATVDWCRYLNGPPPGAGLAHRAYCPALQICDGNAAWTATDQRYLITSTVKICPTGTLDVGPGVSLNLVPGLSSFQVEGTLNINGTGTLGASVQLFSNSATPAAGDWVGMEFRPGSTGSIHHANISDAFWGVRAASAAVAIADSTFYRMAAGGIEAKGGSLSVAHTAVTDPGDFGVSVDDGASFVLDTVDTSGALVGIGVRDAATGTIVRAGSHSNTLGLSVLPSVDGPAVVSVHSSRFVDNATGVSISGGGNGFINPEVVISSSSLYDNTDIDLIAGGGWENPDSTTLWAPDNWWGTTDPGQIAEAIYDRNDSQFSPRVVTRPFGSSCEAALGRNTDTDLRGDFEDNCPSNPNSGQADADGDGMGDACDPEPATAPTGACDGVDDTTDGFADSDGDGWGDPCDFHPLRADSYPGAPELCDGRDNDGDLVFADGELVDVDEDGAVACVDLTGDCNDADPAVFPCACESCGNAIDDDCDGSTDLADATCLATPFCVSVIPGTRPLELELAKGDCNGAVAAGPFDVIRGDFATLGFAGNSVDLGDVVCSSASLVLDRVTDLTEASSPGCDESSLFWLAAPSGAPDYGTGSGGQPRDVSNPDPACP